GLVSVAADRGEVTWPVVLSEGFIPVLVHRYYEHKSEVIWDSIGKMLGLRENIRTAIAQEEAKVLAN
ncbi:hypothetical protein, partial [Deinococcus aerolatus]|uniref:hypothetical protein n=1 Tax=Deinococcus aerolatus TaxID=522487 RepID=UPI001E658215